MLYLKELICPKYSLFGRQGDALLVTIIERKEILLVGNTILSHHQQIYTGSLSLCYCFLAKFFFDKYVVLKAFEEEYSIYPNSGALQY